MQQVQCHEWWYESHANKQKNIKTRFQDLEQCDESFYVTYMYKTEETVRKHFVEQTVIRRIDTGVVYTASTNCWLQSGIQSRWMRKKIKKNLVVSRIFSWERRELGLLRAKQSTARSILRKQTRNNEILKLIVIAVAKPPSHYSTRSVSLYNWNTLPNIE